jgi:hypothetical protein
MSPLKSIVSFSKTGSAVIWQVFIVVFGIIKILHKYPTVLAVST